MNCVLLSVSIAMYGYLLSMTHFCDFVIFLWILYCVFICPYYTIQLVGQHDTVWLSVHTELCDLLSNIIAICPAWHCVPATVHCVVMSIMALAGYLSYTALCGYLPTVHCVAIYPTWHKHYVAICPQCIIMWPCVQQWAVWLFVPQ